MACNKRRPGSGCSAIGGLSHNLAVLGTSEACIATQPSDMCVALRALDAVVEVTGADGTTRQIPIADFHLLPGDTPHIETALQAGELITAVVLPPPLGGTQLYRKVRDRASYAFANVSLALVARLEDGAPLVERLAFGGLALKPWRIAAAERGPRDPDAIADIVLAGATPTPDNAYKLPLVRRMLAAALEQLA